MAKHTHQSLDTEYLGVSHEGVFWVWGSCVHAPHLHHMMIHRKHDTHLYSHIISRALSLALGSCMNAVLWFSHPFHIISLCIFSGNCLFITMPDFYGSFTVRSMVVTPRTTLVKSHHWSRYPQLQNVMVLFTREGTEYTLETISKPGSHEQVQAILTNISLNPPQAQAPTSLTKALQFGSSKTSTSDFFGTSNAKNLEAIEAWLQGSL